jgi:hypothetical protein
MISPDQDHNNGPELPVPAPEIQEKKKKDSGAFDEFNQMVNRVLEKHRIGQKNAAAEPACEAQLA